MTNARSITAGGGRRLVRWPLSGVATAIALFVIAIGALLGGQIVSPTKRVIEAAAGLLLVYVLWSSSAINALWILLVVYPFPFAIALGNSTFVFVVAMFIIYLVRVSAKIDTIHLDRMFNLPLGLFVLSYIVSFYNLPTEAYTVRFALVHTGNVIACVLLFYMIVNLVNSDKRLEATMRVMAITAAAIIVFTVLEMLFPGRTLIPGWLYTQHKEQLIMKGVRLGGPFRDYELVAEFFAMNVPLIFFLLIRSARLLTKSIYGALLLADIIMMFTTITRGAFISLSIGLVYMAWTFRRELTFARLVSLVSAFLAVVFTIDFLVARYTISGSLFGRMLQTTFEAGIVPSNRVLAWGGALNRALEHPFIGHGPGWDFTKAFDTAIWPHDLYLFYFNITGLFGLFAFLFLLWRLWRASSITLSASMRRSPFPDALLMVLNVNLLIFIIDQVKIDYPRNDLYMYFIWIFFGLIAAAHSIVVQRERARLRPGPSRVSNVRSAAMLTSRGTSRSV